MSKINTNLSTEAVQKQLQLILQCNELKHSPVLSKFFQFIVTEKLAGREDNIKEYTIGVNALGRSKDFNPQLDAIVRIHAGRLRKIISQYYQTDGSNDAIIIDVPKGSYVPSFAGRNGNSVPLHNDLPKFITDTTQAPQKAPARQKPVLAVLPFHNLSPENSKDFFVNGIGEQLSTDLARFQNIAVISYYSTNQYNTSVIDLQEMKKSMHVDYILTGSVRCIGDNIRLNIRLILTENGEIIWADTYQDKLTSDNIFDIQEEMVSRILNATADDHGVFLKLDMAQSSSEPSEKYAVQEAIHNYYNYTLNYDPQRFQHTYQGLEKAVKKDPTNALACALFSCLHTFGYASSVTEDQHMLDEAMRLAKVAVELDEYSQPSQKALALGLLFSGKKERSIETMEYCISLNPKASTTVATIGLGFMFLGDYRRGYNCLNKALSLTFSMPYTSKVGLSLYHYKEKNFEESLRWIQRLHINHMPFAQLLELANLGKLNHQEKRISISPELLENAPAIINRFVFDPELKADIHDGLELAGLTVN